MVLYLHSFRPPKKTINTGGSLLFISIVCICIYSCIYTYIYTHAYTLTYLPKRFGLSSRRVFKPQATPEQSQNIHYTNLEGDLSQHDDNIQ